MVVGGTSLLGGRFSIAASVLGAVIIQAINTGILLSGFPPEFNLIIKAAIIIFILVLQSPRFRTGVSFLSIPKAAGKPTEREANEAEISSTYGDDLDLFLKLRALRRAVSEHALDPCDRKPSDRQCLPRHRRRRHDLVILSGGIDLSIGAVIAFAGVFLAVVLEHGGMHPLVAFALLLAVTTLFGALMGAIIHYLEMPAFIVTLAGMFLARGMAFVLSIDSIPIKHPFYATLKSLYFKLPGGGRITLIGGLMLFVFAVGILIAHRTRFGTNIYALGGGTATAKLMGVPVAATTIRIYALSGLLAGLSGIVFSLYPPPDTRWPPSASSWTPSPPSSSAERCSPADPASLPERWSGSSSRVSSRHTSRSTARFRAGGRRS